VVNENLFANIKLSQGLSIEKEKEKLCINE